MRRSRLTACVIALTLGVGAGVSACSTSSKPSATTSPPANVSTTLGVVGTSVPKNYVPTKEVPAAALEAIQKYETKKGPALGTWVITGAQLSTVDPTYVLFKVSPAEGHENEVQGGYGFARNVGGKWTVLGYGTDAVGCPPGTPENPAVPAKVLAAFALTCAPVS